MIRQPELEGASFVAIGSFNPTIFQPRWLGAQQLIRPEEAENAKITVIQAEIADFSTGWFQLQVLQNRLQLASQDPRQYGPLRDLASALFVLLPHTPVKLVGVTRTFHFKMPSIEAWHTVGHVLAPKEVWNELLVQPGLRAIVVQGARKDAPSGGRVHVKIEPSTKVELGLYVEVNEEFQAPTNDDSALVDGSNWVSNRLTEHWEPIIRFAETVADRFLRISNP
jgi:hypothetical protein